MWGVRHWTLKIGMDSRCLPRDRAFIPGRLPPLSTIEYVAKTMKVFRGNPACAFTHYVRAICHVRIQGRTLPNLQLNAPRSLFPSRGALSPPVETRCHRKKMVITTGWLFLKISPPGRLNASIPEGGFSTTNQATRFLL